MNVHALACGLADRLAAVNGHPVTVVLLVPFCAATIFLGWLSGSLQLALLSLTTVLSVQASLAGASANLQLKKQDPNSNPDPSLY